jgi:hemoglobin/transferrin/lactoferrin receptor protein
MKHWVALLAALAPACAMTAADTNLTIWVTGTRLPVDPLAAPFHAANFTRETIAARHPQTLPDILEGTPGVLLQKTAPGHTSPFIRGFTGFRTLMLVDGLRLNHSAFRDGANQYWNTIDPYALDRVELAEGGGAVLYGSDAVGGTLQAFTPDPPYASAGAIGSGSLGGGFRSASESRLGRIEGAVADTKTALSAGLTRLKAGDIEAGGSTGRQPKTGYDATAFDLKLRQRLDPDRELVLAWQHHLLNDVWRTHRTIHGKSWHGTTVGNELKRVTDNSRDQACLQYRDGTPTAAYDTWRGTLAYQRHAEDEQTVKKNGSTTDQGFDIDTLALLAESNKANRWGDLAYGFDLYIDTLDSRRLDFDAETGMPHYAIQGPVADDARYTSFGLYGEQTFALQERLDLILGMRGTMIHADAGCYQDPISRERAAFDKTWWDLTGSARAVYWLDPPRTTAFYTSFGRAFRAPNFSDLTRFDTARSGEIETPQTGLDPEQFYTTEIGFKSRRGRTALQVAGFYTSIRDLIVRYPTGRSIADKPEVTKANAASGYVYGFVADLTRRLADPLQTRLSLAWAKGMADAFDTSVQGASEPIRALPLTAEWALRWTGHDRRWWVETAVAAVAREARLSSADRRDTQRIPPDGTPGYATAAIRGGWQPTRRLGLLAAFENALDKDYRIHGSGSNEPGRSLNLFARVTF